MMLRVFSLVLSTYFIFGQIGVELSLHHCMGQTSYTLFGIEFHQTCTCDHDINGGMDHCCHSEKVTLKVKTDDPVQTPSSFLSIPLYSLMAVLPFEMDDNSGISEYNSLFSYPEKAPPGKYTPIFIFSKSLLI
jgi:hypothetical protein